MSARTNARRDWLWLGGGLLALLGISLWVAWHNGSTLLSNSYIDSYTQQALAWRSGRMSLPESIPWLELALYEGKYYVSFPPVPTIPVWLLTFLFGENVPSGLVTLLYFLGIYVVLYWLTRRYLGRIQATVLSLFALLGGSVLDLAVSGSYYAGSVWYQAQLLGMLFTALAFYLMDGKASRPMHWAFSLICIALSVGCRPFNALYVPLLLWWLYTKVRRDTLWRTIIAMLPYIVVPALIACAYGAYNFARFGNPLEFGHRYLPELAQAGEGMFIPSRLWKNIRYMLRPPSLEDGQLQFPILFGFAVYLTNPMLLLGTERVLERGLKRRADAFDLILLGTVLLQAILLSMHRTNGGWQYGTRYLCDLLPALVYLVIRNKQALRRVEVFAMGMLVAFNVYGTIVFHHL